MTSSSSSSMRGGQVGQQEEKDKSKQSRNPLPNLPIPEPILSNIPGTWAYDTMSRRIDEEILHRTALDNGENWSREEFTPIRQRFEQLRNELRNAATTKLTHLDDDYYYGKVDSNASVGETTGQGTLTQHHWGIQNRQKEQDEWRQILDPLIQNGDTWLTAPWLISEFYVYRRLMQVLGYFDKTSPGYLYDPFLKQKQAGLLSSVASAEGALSKIAKLAQTAPIPEGIALAAGIALWGNKMDLSLWPADASAGDTDVFSAILAAASENLLHDDTGRLAQRCQVLHQRGGGEVDIIVDNAGFELVTDLALAQYLVQSGVARTVTFQMKSHPTFVSDALEKDLRDTVQYYQRLDPKQYPAAHAAGMLWNQFLESGQWKCHEDPFWVQPYAMWEMTEPLRTDLITRCDLAFVKGDANYRRLLGDRQWDLTAPFADVVGSYFPCPVCALRTLKAEIGCGMDPDQIRRAVTLDPQSWMTNGRFGVIHYGEGSTEK